MPLQLLPDLLFLLLRLLRPRDRDLLRLLLLRPLRLRDLVQIMLGKLQNIPIIKAFSLQFLIILVPATVSIPAAGPLPTGLLEEAPHLVIVLALAVSAGGWGSGREVHGVGRVTGRRNRQVDIEDR